ncbi:MAG: ribbon-helix-helix domain-containing protein [Candidatus Bathyarchaeia archaeon]|nr:hypothetical protein [Candidatus Bathyarchaeota archaeon]
MEPEKVRGKRGRRKSRVEYSAISIPISILEEIDRLIEEAGYWPSRGAFVREACLEKIERERKRPRKPKTTKEE